MARSRVTREKKKIRQNAEQASVQCKYARFPTPESHSTMLSEESDLPMFQKFSKISALTSLRAFCYEPGDDGTLLVAWL
jgi:hypothetical protein